MSIKPRQMTDEELAIALDLGVPGASAEAAVRLRGELTASVQESVPRRRFITDVELKMIDILATFEIETPEELETTFEDLC
jgi:hypothetical protein